MVTKRLLEVIASRLKMFAAIAVVASSMHGGVSYAEGPEGLVFYSKKDCEETSPSYTKVLDTGKVSSFCLANDASRSYYYPAAQETWEYKCRQTSATTWGLYVNSYSKSEFALAKPPSTWSSLRGGSEGCLEKLYWKTSTVTNVALTAVTNNAQSTYTSYTEKTTTPALVSIVQSGTNLVMQETAKLTTQWTAYGQPGSDKQQRVLDSGVSYYSVSSEWPTWRSIKK